MGGHHGREVHGSTPVGRDNTHKFGPLPQWAEAELAAADSDTLEFWAERVLSEGREPLKTYCAVRLQRHVLARSSPIYLICLVTHCAAPS